MKAHVVTILLFLSINTALPSFAEEKPTPKDQQKLEVAKAETERFLDHYRRTWDFKGTWGKFRSEKEQCGVDVFDRGFGITARPGKLKVSKRVRKDYFFSFWDYFLTSGAYVFSSAPITDHGPDRNLIPNSDGLNRLKATEKKFTFLNLFGDSDVPESPTERDFEKMMQEMNEFSLLLKKYMPADVMDNDRWRKSVAYFHERYGPTEDVVTKVPENKEWDCAMKYAPLYVVAITDQYFVWIDEGGKMKLLTLAKLVD